MDLVAGDLYVLRYKSIKPFVENGQIDLVWGSFFNTISEYLQSPVLSALRDTGGLAAVRWANRENEDVCSLSVLSTF